MSQNGPIRLPGLKPRPDTQEPSAPTASVSDPPVAQQPVQQPAAPQQPRAPRATGNDTTQQLPRVSRIAQVANHITAGLTHNGQRTGSQPAEPTQVELPGKWQVPTAIGLALLSFCACLFLFGIFTSAIGAVLMVNAAQQYKRAGIPVPYMVWSTLAFNCFTGALTLISTVWFIIWAAM